MPIVAGSGMTAYSNTSELITVFVAYAAVAVPSVASLSRAVAMSAQVPRLLVLRPDPADPAGSLEPGIGAELVDKLKFKVQPRFLRN